MAVWAFDIECAEWDQMVCAAAVADDGRKLVFFTDAEVRDWYISLPPKDEVIAHNGGGYDFIYLISICDMLTWSASMAGSSIVTCRAKGFANCRDSFRLFPASLAKWTGQKGETGLECICGQTCGGYCSISRHMESDDLQRLADYNVNDCEILLDTWQRDLNALEGEGLSVYNNKGKPRTTIGAVAWNTAAPLAGINPQSPVSWKDYDAGRTGYYGGRTEVGRVEATHGHRYDVHAMYPWALTHPVPYGLRRGLRRNKAGDAYARGRAGIYRAKVHVPRTDIPPLPHRFPDDRKAEGRLTPGRLLWTSGTFVGSWTQVELAAAERHGARIEQIYSAHIWSHQGAIFKPYVEAIYESRRTAKERGDKRWASLLKWFANSLSGKLAQQPEMTRLCVLGKDEYPEEGWGHVAGRVWMQSVRKPSACARTWAAAYLTSRARVCLLDRLKRHSGKWLYCDTDSTYICERDDKDTHPDRLGAWGYDGEANDWLCLAPKLYRFRDENKREHVRARGIPRPTWDTLDTLRTLGPDGAPVTVRREVGVDRIKTAGGTFRRRTIKRTHRDATTGRAGTRHVNADGTTRPLHAERNGDYV